MKIQSVLCAFSVVLCLPALADVTNRVPTSATGGSGAASTIQIPDANFYTITPGNTARISGFTPSVGGEISSVVLHMRFSVNSSGYNGTNSIQVNGVNTPIVPVNGDNLRTPSVDITSGNFRIDTWPEITALAVTFANNHSGSAQSVLMDHVYLVINHTTPLFAPPTWSDEFNDSGPPNPNVWSFEQGFIRGDEPQWYQSDNAWQQNGNLVIEARRERVRNTKYVANSPNGNLSREYADYTSSSIGSKDRYSFKYGRMQVRAKVPFIKGSFPAIWTIGNVGDWPHNGECDIMEYYRPDVVLANIAVGNNGKWNAKWAGYRTPVSPFFTETNPNPNWRDEYHIWTMQWDQDNVRLYLDNYLMLTTPQSELINGDITWGAPKEPFKQPHFILLNLAIDKTADGDPSSTAFPLRYEVDYVRVWEGLTENNAPTDISLSSNALSENMPSGSVVGNLTATDIDAAEIHRFSLVSGAGDTHNSSFDIVFNSDQTKTSVLRTKTVISAANGLIRNIRVRVTDIEGTTYDKALTLRLFGNSVIEVSPSSLSVAEGGNNFFDVRLKVAPTTSVSVSVSRLSGDFDLSVTSGSTLTFTPQNATTWQRVTLSAAQDADRTNGVATFICSENTGIFQSASVLATEIENLLSSSPAASFIFDSNLTTTGQTDGAGAWTTTNQWWNGSANSNWTSGGNAIFGNGGNGGNVTLSSDTTANALVFNSFNGTYNIGISGQAITLNSGITKNIGAGEAKIVSPIILGAAQDWTNHSAGLLSTGTGAISNNGFLLNVGGTGNTTIAGAISGTGGLSKTGSGILSLNGPSSYNGPTTITDTGGIQLAHPNAIGSSPMNLASGTTLRLRNDSDITFNAPIATPSSAVNYHFDVNNLGGVVTGKTLSLGNIRFATNTLNTINVTGGSAYKLGLGELSSTSGYGQGWPFTINATSAAVNIAKFSTGSYGSNLILKGGNSINLANFELNSNGANSLVVSGNGTVVNLGSTTATNNRGYGRAVEYMLNGGTLNLTTPTSLANAYSFDNWIEAPTLAINGGTLNNTSGSPLTLAPSPSNGTIAGSPNIRLSGDFNYGTPSSTNANDLDLGSGNLNIYGATRTITVNGTTNLTIRGKISNGTITKAGTGTLTLGGRTDYFGDLVIGSGVFAVGSGASIYQNDSQSGRAVVTVSTGGTLQLNSWQANSNGDIGNLNFNAERLIVNGGTISYTGNGEGQRSNLSGRLFTVGTGGATLNAAGTGTWFIEPHIGYDTTIGQVIPSSLSLTLAGPSNGQLNKQISGGGSLIKSGTGTGTWSLGGQNTFSGNITVSDGTLALSPTGGAYTDGYTSSPVVTVSSGGTLQLAGWQYGAQGSLKYLDFGAERLRVNGGTISYVGNGEGQGDANNGRLLSIGTGGATLNAAGTGTWFIEPNASYDTTIGQVIPSSLSLTLAGPSSGQFNKKISGGGSLIKSGTGTWSLGGQNTFSGNITVSTGTLELSPTGGVYTDGYTSLPVVTVSSGGTLQLAGWQYGAQGSLKYLDFAANRLQVNGGAITYTGIGEGQGSANNGRLLSIGTAGATLNAAGTGTWFIEPNASYDTTTGQVIPSSSSLTLTGSSNGQLNKQLSGGGSLIKSGTGTWSLGGMNTYTGVTTISGGILRINGSLDASSPVSVNQGATLGGRGRINGNVTVSSGGNLAPGDSVGTLNITGNLNISALANGGAGKLRFELGAPNGSNDQVPVSGTLTIGVGALGFNDFVFSNIGGLAATGSSPYKLISYGSIAQSNTLDPNNLSGTLPGNLVGTLQIINNSIELVVTGNGYTSWAVARNITGGYNGDADNDGATNLMEYALIDGGEKGITTANSISFTKRGGIYSQDLTYVIETSKSLTPDSWTPLVTHGPELSSSNPTISFDFTPNQSASQFYRLKVTTTP